MDKLEKLKLCEFDGTWMGFLKMSRDIYGDELSINNTFDRKRGLAYLRNGRVMGKGYCYTIKVKE